MTDSFQLDSTAAFAYLMATRYTPAAVPACYAKAAKAKIRRDAASYEAFRAQDQITHEESWKRSVASALNEATEEAQDWREDNAEAESQVTAARDALREAEDRRTDAKENEAKAVSRYEFAKDSGSAAEESSAMIEVQAAGQVLTDRRRAEAEAQDLLEKTEEQLDEVRAALITAERTLREAVRRSEMPCGSAPVSQVTIRENSAYMQSCDAVWHSLSRDEQNAVNGACPKVRDVVSANGALSSVK